ncbi:MFS transporter [Paenarthrobacter sp. NPDC057981]|uniref:MFS transporter n=1 Tax=Paenarthrobacter sp. NPDC057981 TaxID=3346297 RepID=UPI0036D7D286
MTEQKTRRQPGPWRVAVVAGMASYIDAAALISFGIAIVIYQAAFGLAADQVGVLAGAITFGVAVGALAGGRLGDRFGRRPVFSVTMLMIIGGAALLVTTDSFVPLLVGTLLVGVGTGADLPVSLSTISEAADDENRGRMISFSNVLWIAGVLVAIILSTVVGNLGRLGGQILFAHVGIVAAVVLIARLSIPESLVWLAAREERAKGLHTARASRSSVSSLFRKPYRAPLIVLVVFYSLVNLAANTGGQFGTYMLVNYAGLDVSSASLFGLIAMPVLMLSYFWFMRVADGPRRFTYFTVGAVLYVVSLLVPVIFGFSATTYIVSGVLGAVGAGFAFETVMKVWAQESFPTLIRSTAQGTILAVARFVAAILATFTPMLLTSGPSALYLFLAGVTAVGMAVAWFGFRNRDQHNEFDTEQLTDGTAAAAPAASSATFH